MSALQGCYQAKLRPPRPVCLVCRPARRFALPRAKYAASPQELSIRNFPSIQRTRRLRSQLALASPARDQAQAALLAALAGRPATTASLSELRVVDLRSLCTDLGIRPGKKKKADLVDAILEASRDADARNVAGAAQYASPEPGTRDASDTTAASSSVSDADRPSNRLAYDDANAESSRKRIDAVTEDTLPPSPAAVKQHEVVQHGTRNTRERPVLDIAKESGALWERQDTWVESVRAHAAGNATGMAVTWLGTSSGAPSAARNISAIALRIGQPETILLVDAGEGTQYQFGAFGLDMCALKQIFVTHHHGDHIFGLPGLLAARNDEFVARGQAPEPLRLYGPPGTANVVVRGLAMGTSALRSRIAAPARVDITEWCLDERDGMNATPVDGTDGSITVSRRPPDQAHPRWSDPVNVHVIAHTTRRPGIGDALPVCDGLTWTVAGAGGLRVQSAQLHHRVPCWGYVFEEPSDPEKRIRGRKVVLLGDTHDSTPIRHLARGANVLSHEATFLNEMHHKAKVATHSTGSMAAVSYASGAAGEGIEAEMRSMARDVQTLQREAGQAMHSKNVMCAYDGYTCRL